MENKWLQFSEQETPKLISFWDFSHVNDERQPHYK